MALEPAPRPPPQFLPSKTTDIPNVPSSNHHSRLLFSLKRCSDMSQLKQIHAQTLRSTSPHHPKTFFLYFQILHFSFFHDFSYALKLFNQIKSPKSARSW
ncbi:hypothetical protein V6N11_024835 [Hibiscus sabdariffa]|uniref:Uncharacterized protein n=1 Tax=Hibiscus sabdariffa TaxID=183260 RepID=A0ABR2QN98_9ROSI